MRRSPGRWGGQVDLVFNPYGWLIALGILTAVLLARRDEKRLGLPKDTAIDVALTVVPLGVLGARLYYVLFRWSVYAANPISALYIWEGGLAIYGGLIGGFLGLVLLSRVKRLKLPALIDLIIPYVLLAQAIGRWGNYFNGEAYGQPVLEAALQFFPYAVNVGGEWFQATFFYESAADLVGFLILFFTRKRWRLGDGLPLYCIVYGIPRAVIEGMRSDSLYIGGTGIRVSQLLSAVLVALACGHFLYRYVIKRRKPLEQNAVPPAH